MIVTEGLTKRFGTLTAVDNLNLHVEKGEIFGFLGPNGAGKTTTIMMILGLLQPTAGRVRLFGKLLPEDYFGIKRRLGVLSEYQYMYDEMTALEYLQFFARLYAVEHPNQRIQEVLERVRLRDRQQELVGGYSKGMKQKLGLARVLLHDPEILILDEPTNSLDPYGVREVRDILMEEHERGRTLLISSHLLSEVERICGRVGIMNKGRLLAEATMDELRQRLSQEMELRVDLDQLPASLIPALQQIPGVSSIDVSEQPSAGAGATLIIKAKPGSERRTQVARAIAEAGALVLGMQTVEMSLEEAFVTITENNISLLAEEGVA
ncbi:MAG: ABC transporter ATP-binding protein [Limnochordaceae bacterium]|nr:ABC transporter ATP-binding protein [Limnochordaceae bacterium]